MIGIYEIYNKCNDKRYVGSSNDVEYRFKTHKRQLRTNSHFNIHLQSSWNKYDEDSFEFNVIEECEQDELLVLEKRYIEKLDAMENGYNLSPDPMNGSRGITWTRESRDKLSRSLKKAYSNGDREPVSFTHTEEVKKSISESARGHEPSHRRSVWCHQTGEEYCSLHHAAEAVNRSVSGVCDVLSGRYKQIRGYTFEYAEYSNREVRDKVRRVSRIMCVETGVVYDTQTEAAKSVGVKSCDVGRNIKKGRKTKGYTFRLLDKDI